MQKCTVQVQKCTVKVQKCTVSITFNVQKSTVTGWSCLTGQLPGICHLYTGGSGCARKQGQVQVFFANMLPRQKKTTWAGIIKNHWFMSAWSTRGGLKNGNTWRCRSARNKHVLVVRSVSENCGSGDNSVQHWLRFCPVSALAGSYFLNRRWVVSDWFLHSTHSLRHRALIAALWVGTRQFRSPSSLVRSSLSPRPISSYSGPAASGPGLLPYPSPLPSFLFCTCSCPVHLYEMG